MALTKSRRYRVRRKQVDALRRALSASRSRRDMNRNLMSRFDGPVILSTDVDDLDDVGMPCLFSDRNQHSLGTRYFLRMKLGEFGRMLEFCDAHGDAIQKWAFSNFLRCNNNNTNVFPSVHFFEIELLGHVLIFGVRSERQANEWVDEIPPPSRQLVFLVSTSVYKMFGEIFLGKVYVWPGGKRLVLNARRQHSRHVSQDDDSVATVAGKLLSSALCLNSRDASACVSLIEYAIGVTQEHSMSPGESSSWTARHREVALTEFVRGVRARSARISLLSLYSHRLHNSEHSHTHTHTHTGPFCRRISRSTRSESGKSGGS